MNGIEARYMGLMGAKIEIEKTLLAMEATMGTRRCIPLWVYSLHKVQVAKAIRSVTRWTLKESLETTSSLWDEEELGKTVKRITALYDHHTQ